MTLKKDKINKTILITGTVIVIAIFSSILATINTSVNSFTGTSCIVSAFAG